MPELPTKLRVVPIVPAAALICSPATLTAIQDYADAMGISAMRLADDIIAEWMQCVGSERLKAETKKKKSGKISQNEKKRVFRM